MKVKYTTIKDGEGIEVGDGEITKIRCCDCGLVHEVGVAIEDNGMIGLAFKRDNRATAQIRRHKQHGGGGAG